MLYLCTRWRVFPLLMCICLKERGDLCSYHWIFGSLQVDFYSGWNKAFSSSRGSTAGAGAARCSFPTAAHCGTAWNGGTGKWGLSSVVLKWCNHQRQIRSVCLTALTVGGLTRTFNSPVVHEKYLYFLAAWTTHTQLRPDFAFIYTREQLSGIQLPQNILVSKCVLDCI